MTVTDPSSTRLEVLHVSSFDLRGGAARAAFRLHAGLGKIGVDSRMVVAERSSDDESVLVHPRARAVPERLLEMLRRRTLTNPFVAYDQDPYAESFSGPHAWQRHLSQHIRSARVVNLHWVAWFLDWQNFFSSVGREVPVVWTLHDMNPFTGGCHYDRGCGRFREACGACPLLRSSDHGDVTRSNVRLKTEVLRTTGRQITVVSPSRWLADEARRSKVFNGMDVRVIPYGLDLETFAPRDRQASRIVLGLPRDRPVVMFAADSVTNIRKGAALLERSLTLIEPTRRPVLMTVGRGRLRQEGFEHVSVGKIDNDRLLSHVYSAADLFVIPSLQDNLPNTVVESLACGTPVVGFDVGGIPDMVRPEVTGVLAKAGDVDDMAAAIQRMLAADLDGYRVRCRQVAETEYGQHLQAQRYRDLYLELLQR